MGHSDDDSRALINNRFCSFVPSQAKLIANDEDTDCRASEHLHCFVEKREKMVKKWKVILKEPANELADAIATNCELASKRGNDFDF